MFYSVLNNLKCSCLCLQYDNIICIRLHVYKNSLHHKDYASLYLDAGVERKDYKKIMLFV